MQEVRDRIATLAPLPWHVRIEGPTGTGKRAAAATLHRKSLRSDGPFVPCYLNMLPDETALDELAGHVRGAFTTAVSDRLGAAESANGGTLCFDEMGTATPLVQQALLQLVDEQSIKRLGESRTRHVDVRLIFLTNVDLERAVHEDRFRADLYWRLGLLVLTMPPLKAHRDDVPQLVAHIMARKSREAGLEEVRMAPRDMDTLLEYEWPGNVRQLERVIEHYLAFNELPDSIRVRTVVDWRSKIDDVLLRHGGNKAAAARELGISRKTLFEELKKRRLSAPSDDAEA